MVDMATQWQSWFVGLHRRMFRIERGSTVVNEPAARSQEGL